MATGKTLELSIKIAGKMDKSLTAAINGTQSKLGSLTKGLSTVGTIGLAAMGAITTAAVGTVAASTKSAAALEQSMSSVKTLLVGTEQAVNARTDQLTNDVMRISVETGVATTDLADGLYQVISAFQDTADSAAILEIATKAAKAGKAEMVDTVNALAAVTKAYGDTSAEQVQYIANLSFETIRLGQTTMPELANGIQKVSGAAAALNVSQAELYAGFASLTGVMGNTDNVGTALNTLYMKMLKPSTAITKAVQSFGYSSAYAMVQAEGIGNTIKKLGDYAGSADAFAAMFSMRDLKAAQQILNNYDVYTDKLHQLEAVTADSEQANNAFQTQIDNCNSSIGIIANSFSVLGQSFGQRFLPYLKDFAIMAVPAVQGWVNKMMDGFNVLEPYIANVAGAIMPSIENAFSKVGTVIDDALPKVTQFLDYISKHGEQTVKVIGGLAGTFAAMKFAPLAGNLLEGAGSLLFGESGGLGAAAGGSKRSGGLLGAVGSLFTGGQRFAGNAVSAISNVTEAAGVGAAMANSNMTQTQWGAVTSNGSGSFKQRLENSVIGAYFGIKNRGTLTNQKGSDYKFMQGLMGVAGKITDAKQNGGILGAIQRTPVMQYFGGIRTAAGKVADTTIGGGLLNFGKKHAAGIFGAEGLDVPGVISRRVDKVKGFGGLVADKASNIAFTVANSGVGQAIGGAAGKVGGVAKGVVSVGSNALGALGNFAGAGAGLLGSVWGPMASGFGSLFAGAAPVIAAISGIIAVVSILGDHLEDIRGIVVNVFGETGGQIFDVFTGKLQGVADFVTGLFSEGGVAAALAPLQNTITNLFGENAGAAFGGVVTILQSIMGVVGQIVTFATGTVKPIIENVFKFITGTVLPIILQTFTAAAPTIASIISNIGSAVMTGMQIIGTAIQAVMPVVQGVITVILSIASAVIPRVLAGFNAFATGFSAILVNIQAIVSAVIGVFSGLITFITGVFTGNWSKAWEGVKQIFGSIMDGLVELCKIPINTVISIINAAIAGVNKLGITIPEWVPVLGGKSFKIDLPQIPMLAKGGFTDGVSIAGEAGTEAVISFQRGVRSDNINTWTQAGRMLGVSGEQAAVAAGVPYADGGGAVELATIDAAQGNNAVELQEIDTGKPQTEQGGGTPDGGGQVVFAPQIVVQGNADRAVLESVLDDAQQRFELWYEQMMRRKARTAY